MDRRNFLKVMGGGAAATTLLVGSNIMGTQPEKDPGATFFVSKDGNDAWSGKSAQPNAEKTDASGPCHCSNDLYLDHSQIAK